eukprot:scaffold252025_cov28-Tisochrysis_lutea.AAC.2
MDGCSSVVWDELIRQRSRWACSVCRMASVPASACVGHAETICSNKWHRVTFATVCSRLRHTFTQLSLQCALLLMDRSELTTARGNGAQMTGKVGTTRFP